MKTREDFNLFCSTDKNRNIAEQVLYYSLIQLELLDRDFSLFCKKFEDCIVSHGERWREAAYFEISLTDNYLLCILTEGMKIVSFQIKHLALEYNTQHL